MDKNQVFEARGVEKAIQMAVEALNTERDKLTIEILAEGSPGFLGIGATPSKIRVSIMDTGFQIDGPGQEMMEIPVDIPHQDHPAAGANEPDVDGLLGMRDGMIVLIPPKGKGKYPILVPNAQVEIRVNGNILQWPTQILDTEDIEVSPVKVSSTSQFEIDLSDDLMLATLTVLPAYDYVYELPDTEPTERLQIEPIKRKKPSNKPISVEDVKSGIQLKGVVFGIDEQAISGAVEAADGRPVKAAVGLQPVQPSDGIVELMFDKEIQEDPDKKTAVDYREMHKQASVEAGVLLARLKPAQDGMPGMTVTGVTVGVKSAKPAKLLAGTGVVQQDAEFYSLKAGRPEIVGPSLRVQPILAFNTDISMETGNVHFNGDVVVHGNVQPGMKVEADGLIEIDGIVEQAVITARDGVITLKRVINSVVRAGGAYAARGYLLPYAKKVAEGMEVLLEAVREVNARRVENGLLPAPINRIIGLMLENKLRDMPRLTEGLVNVGSSQEIELEPTEMTLFQSIARMMSGASPKEEQEEMLEEMLEQLKTWISDVEIQRNRKSDVYIAYSLKSRIYASGRIVAEGQGCLNSTLVSGDAVVVKGTPGVFRGGQISANGDVFINDAGSDLTLTKVEVTDKRKIILNKVSGALVAQIGKQTTRIDGPKGSTLVYKDHEGILKVN